MNALAINPSKQSLEFQRGWNAALVHAEAAPIAYKQVRDFRRLHGEQVPIPGLTDGMGTMGS